jgi:hypothetical protein
MEEKNKALSSKQIESLLLTLKTRFEKNMNRHIGMDWKKIQLKLETNTEKLWSLNEMERTGGEPDVVDYISETDTYFFFDCSTETPQGRRSICYDRAAMESRKDNKPHNNASDMAATIGIELLNEVQYKYLQSLGSFDNKTSSWIQTPDHIRQLGGALFADFRYNTVFIYHNSAGSYYAVRGFRGMLMV